jgi:putative toxin-antitoxin system antitoxin component (TIGR02293 family)
MGLKKIKPSKLHPESGKVVRMRIQKEERDSFTIKVGDKEKSYVVSRGFGYFIPSFKKAANLTEITALVDKGISSHEIQRVINYLDFKVPEIAKAASVSVSTVSRWDRDSSIGSPGSGQFFRIDEIIRKGIALFGGENELKQWLMTPNMALGNTTPAHLVISNPGVDLVDEAMDALGYGSVL